MFRPSSVRSGAPTPDQWVCAICGSWVRAPLAVIQTCGRVLRQGPVPSHPSSPVSTRSNVL
eukprot:3138835-Prymnesium_polylepis.5